MCEDVDEKNEMPDKYLKKESDGPKPKKVTLRDYQKTLFQKSQDRNSIVYLPTGLGKTRIAIASMYYYLSFTQKKKIVFLANTVQLVKQQAGAIKDTLYGIIQEKALCREINKKHAGNEVYLDWSWDRICREVVCIHGEKNDELGQTKKKKI
jgi:type I site-specific restriction endonuclease